MTKKFALSKTVTQNSQSAKHDTVPRCIIVTDVRLRIDAFFCVKFQDYFSSNCYIIK